MLRLTAVYDFTPGTSSYTLLSEKEQDQVTVQLRQLPGCAQVSADFCPDVVPAIFGQGNGRSTASFGATDTVYAVILEQVVGRCRRFRLYAARLDWYLPVSRLFLSRN
jgi:hypothetical protein